jgi:hypothetical protein
MRRSSTTTTASPAVEKATAPGRAPPTSSRCAVGRGGEREPSSGRNGEREHGIAVLEDRVGRLVAGGDVPRAHGAVEAGGEHALAVGREGGVDDPAAMAVRCALEFPRLCRFVEPPQPADAVRVADQQQRLVGRKREGRHFDVVRQRELQLAC